MRRIFTTQPVGVPWRLLATLAMAGSVVAVICWHLWDARSGPAQRHEPPWLYGPQNARFTVVEYADLECPFCKSHFTAMSNWVDQAKARGNVEKAGLSVNWQWHHLPLPGHEPAAIHEALLAECAGRVHGNAAFWKSVAWLYEHTGTNGLGIPPDMSFPNLTSLHACLQGEDVIQQIRQHVRQAHQAGIMSTPTLVVKDNLTGKTLRLEGPASGDVLLSAIDMLLAAQHQAPPRSPDADLNMPVDTSVNDMPR